MKPSQKPVISVIMAVHNGMPFLKESIKSTLGQSYKNIELIVVEDKSTDDSLKYLKSLKDQRIKLITNKNNLGLAKSLNKAIKAAKGDYIARMDADDVNKKERFKKQITFLDKNEKITICGSWVDLIDEKGNRIGEKKYPKSSEEIYKTLPFFSCIVHPTFFARRNFFTKLNGYNPKYDFAEDYDILMRGRKLFKMANINSKLLMWRHWENRRSRQGMKKMDRIDLRIKIDNIKREGPNIRNLLALVKKIFLTYSLPYPLKLKIARILKTA